MSIDPHWHDANANAYGYETDGPAFHEWEAFDSAMEKVEMAISDLVDPTSELENTGYMQSDDYHRIRCAIDELASWLPPRRDVPRVDRPVRARIDWGNVCLFALLASGVAFWLFLIWHWIRGM